MKANSERVRFPKLQPIDYAFMIGGPSLFLLIAIVGMARIIGPIPHPSAVERIKDGEISPGMTLEQVLHKLGQPKEVQTHDDGTATVIYTRTVADPDLQVEEGVIQVTQSGQVLTTTVDTQLPTKPGT
jgi:hypothetical protein